VSGGRGEGQTENGLAGSPRTPHPRATSLAGGSGVRLRAARQRWLLGRSTTYVVASSCAAIALLAGILVPYVRSEATAYHKVASTLGSSTGSSPATPQAAASAPGASSTSSTPASGSTGASTPVSGGATSSQGTSSGATVGSTAPSAPVVGVTSNEIKLGIGIVNVGAASEFGYNFNIGNEQARYQALIDNVNAAGGIDGRKIVPYYSTFDATNPDVDAQSACVNWTQDVGVFAVIVESQFPTSGEVCVFGQGHTPFITTQGTDQAYYANGLFFSTQASDTRTLTDEADFLASNGSLTGKTIGILTDTGTDQESVQDTLIPRLKQLGYSVADTEAIPDSTAGVQAEPIAISNLKASGANFVIIAANVILAGPFVQAASRAGYNPQWGLSDFNNEINNQVASYYPSSFQGTVGLSTHRFAEYTAGAPFAPADQACLNIVKPVDSTVLPTTNSAFEVAMGDCAVFNAFIAGVQKAGATLTQASFLQGMDSIGTFAIPGTQNGSFTATKHDADDYEQEVAWQESCTCWELVDGLNTPVRPLS
jgi:hypothetical protein